jgi:hypothetical protein
MRAIETDKQEILMIKIIMVLIGRQNQAPTLK